MTRLFQPVDIVNTVLKLDVRSMESYVNMKGGQLQTFCELFTERLPHIYICEDSDLFMNKTVFANISIGLISQHWILAETLEQIDVMRNAAREKNDEIFSALRKSLGVAEHNIQNSPYRADRKFQKLLKQYGNMAIPFLEVQGESVENIKPGYHSPEDPRASLDSTFEVIRDTLNELEREIMVRAFVSLKRLMLRGLNGIINECREPKKHDWKEVDRFSDEKEYVWLLRQLEENLPELDISDFKKATRPLLDLNELRNTAEHDGEKKKKKNKNNTEPGQSGNGKEYSDWYDEDLYSEEKLRDSFLEIKALFEKLESGSRRIVWYS